jgi:hypothetical protein
VVFEGVTDNGGFLALTHCLVQDSVRITTGGVNVTLPEFSLKLDVQLSYWKVHLSFPFFFIIIIIAIIVI